MCKTTNSVDVVLKKILCSRAGLCVESVLGRICAHDTGMNRCSQYWLLLAGHVLHLLYFGPLTVSVSSLTRFDKIARSELTPAGMWIRKR